MQFDIPFQQAVYTRPTSRHRFQFSHARHITVKKLFLPSLTTESLRTAQALKNDNAELLRSYPVLVLVTGDWAQYISVDSHARHHGRVHPTQPYDHLERLGAGCGSAQSSEVSKNFRMLEYHCSLSTYEQGEDHAWGITGVSTMLSEMVILPRVLYDNKVDKAIHGFIHALKKTLRDSLLLAGGRRFKEDTFEAKALAFRAIE